uniref:hypothetical protein n=1 Tax=Enterococcus faecalis TaxID=1351 RepID=UPI0012AE22E6|nr:hypothetical protein [Enterococcus faecalis]
MIQTRLKERFASQFVIAIISFEGRGSPFLRYLNSSQKRRLGSVPAHPRYSSCGNKS